MKILLLIVAIATFTHFSIAQENSDGNTILDVLSNNGASKLHDMIINNPHHTSLIQYMSQTDGTEFTLFAPSDEAIDQSGLSQSNDNDYTDRFHYHMITDERLSTQDINKEQRLRNTTFIPKHGKNHHVPIMMGTSSEGVWSYGDKAKIIHGDIQASNGVVHIIDRVLNIPGSAEQVLRALPQTREFANKLSSLNMSLQLFTHATVFAPINEAIKRVDEMTKDPPTVVLTLNHLIVDKSFNATSIKNSNKVVDNHGMGFNVSHDDTHGAVINGVSILLPDQIYDDGLIHVTDGIVLRGGLDHPEADLPQPKDTSHAIAFTIPSFHILMTMISVLFFCCFCY
ncbi:FAS1 domain-containing protein [Phascolomyces articulosus]|uniref:FAS1 domain-containing protein n=1 Tax=Phascolomyces articulosus TaxID=60185 RepID=A0AAD5PH81_9FUNG|nr:FAS1 domain-containing protein [Phascolomyces articulosus]